MKLWALILLSSLAYLSVYAIDPDRKTNAGEQAATGTKSGDDVKIEALQKGGTKGSGDFSGSASGKGNVAITNQGHKAVAMSETEVKAGTDNDPDQFNVKKDSDTHTASGDDGKAKLDYTDRTDGKVYKPVVTGGGDGVDSTLEQSNDNWQGTGDEHRSKDKHYFVLSGGKTPTGAQVFSKGTQVAEVSNLQDKGNIVIERKIAGSGPAKGVAKSVRVDGTSDVVHNEFDAGPFDKQSATLKEDASHVEIKNGLVKTSAYIPPGQKKAHLSGSFITTGTATVEFSDATEKDCPYDAYGDRRGEGRRNQPWKYRDPTFKVHYKELEVIGGVDEETDSIKAQWPQCMTVKIPISFPQGTRLEKLALGMAVYFPGCPRFVCAGRVCGLEFAAQAGTKVGEACFTDSLCKLKPVPAASRKDDIVGYVAENAEIDLCDKPYRGGKLFAKATICQHEDDRGDSYKACPLLNFSPDETAVDKKIDVLLRLYEKKQCSGFGCLSKGLGICSISRYNLEGCRELGMDYKITAFGLNGDDVKFTGLERRGKGTSSGQGNTGGGGWGNVFGGGFGQGVRPVGETPPPATERPSTNRPWWQRSNWWNSSGK